MKKVSDKKQYILSALSNGKFHSGESLGIELGISRTAVAKHVKGLAELGVDIYRVTGKGYRLSSAITLLDKHKISDYYQQENGSELKLKLESVTTSTNGNLISMIRDGEELEKGQVVIAECQTAGRGRRGRKWISPFGAHLYLSMYWQLDGAQAAMGLSLAMGLAVREAILKVTGVETQLKWPNDVMVDGKKIAGILVELEGQPDGPCHVVVGVGLNVKMPEEQARDITQPWTDLSLETKEPVDRNLLSAELIRSFHQWMTRYEDLGFKAMAGMWNDYNAYQGKPVKLAVGANVYQGVCLGVDEQGGVMITSDGTTKVYYGGEISLRAG